MQDKQWYHTQTFESGTLKWRSPAIHRTMVYFSLTACDITVVNFSNSFSMKCTRPILQSAWQNCSLRFVQTMKQFWMLMKVTIQGRGEESMWHRTTTKKISKAYDQIQCTNMFSLIPRLPPLPLRRGLVHIVCVCTKYPRFLGIRKNNEYLPYV